MRFSLNLQRAERPQAVLFEGGAPPELSACSAASIKFREAHVSLVPKLRDCFFCIKTKEREDELKVYFLFMFLTFLYLRDFYSTGARESPSVDLLLQRKVTKETTPSLRNFFPYQAKTVLSAPRRYRSCPSELPASILNRGSFRFV